MKKISNVLKIIGLGMLIYDLEYGNWGLISVSITIILLGEILNLIKK